MIEFIFIYLPLLMLYSLVGSGVGSVVYRQMETRQFFGDTFLPQKADKGVTSFFMGALWPVLGIPYIVFNHTARHVPREVAKEVADYRNDIFNYKVEDSRKAITDKIEQDLGIGKVHEGKIIDHWGN